MATSPNILPLENKDPTLRKRLIVWLKEPSLEDPQCKRRKSGLIRISSVRVFRRKEDELTKDFKFWMPLPSQSNEAVNEELQQKKIEIKECDKLSECLEYIALYEKKCVILILSTSHAKNKETLSRFSSLSQIALLYRCITETHFKKLVKHWSVKGQLIAKDVIPSLNGRQIKDLDEPNQLILMRIFLHKRIINQPIDDEARNEFENFCRFKYRDKPKDLKKIEDFFETYCPEDAIRYYINPSCFILHIVGETFNSLKTEDLFKIRFYIRDLYMQLQKLHEEQYELCFQDDLVVYRGKAMSADELELLKTKGNLFVTRDFLSTTVDKEVAECFISGGKVEDGEIGVVISMHIKHSEIKGKPIAFVSQPNHTSDECEIMLPMGFVFSIESYKEVDDDTNRWVEIKMIRGEAEGQTEKTLSLFFSSVQISVGGVILGKTISQLTVHDVQQLGESSKLAIHTLRSTDISTTTQPSVTSDHIGTSVHVSNNVMNTKAHITLNMPQDVVHNVPQSSVQTAAHRYEVATVSNGKLLTDGAMHMNHINSCTTAAVPSTAAVGSTQLTHPVWISMIVLVAFAVVTVIVVPTAVFLSRTDSCSPVDCLTNPFVLNPSSDYQVEQLNLTCSQSFSNLTIIFTLQRTLSETYAAQYQTFWNGATAMTYWTTPTQLIYKWYSLPGMIIVNASFPHFVNAQYYYTSGSPRVTSGDTWEIWLQSTCGKTKYLSETF